MPKREAETLAETVISQLRGQGFRRTRALVALLTELATHHHPVTLAELTELPSLAESDHATIYRLMMKLEEAGMVRRLGFHGRSVHFQLVIHGHHHDYLVCKSCGDIAEVDIPCPVSQVEREVAAKSGWRDVEHELEVFGVCPACAR
jgi:Fur family ferric uptake transcriptional regulator